MCILLMSCSERHNPVSGRAPIPSQPPPIAPLATSGPAPEILWTTLVHAGSAAGVDFNADGSLLATAGGRELHVLSAEDGASLWSKTDFPYGLHSAGISSDGRFVATGYLTPAIGHNPAGPVAVLIDRASGSTTTFGSGIYVSFSPDDRYVAVGGGSTDYTVEIYSVSGGRLVARFSVRRGYVSSVAFSPDSRLVAAGSTGDSVVLFDMATQERVDLVGLEEPVADLAFSSSGEYLAAGGRGYIGPTRHIAVWRVNDGAPIRRFPAFAISVYALAFSLDGDRIIAAGREGIYPDPRAAVKVFTMAGDLEQSHDILATSLAASPVGDGLFAWRLPAGAVELSQFTFDDDPPVAENVHVFGISVRTEQIKKNRSVAIASVTIVDQDLIPVSGATVSGTFNNDDTQFNVMTNADGVAEFTSSFERFPPAVWCFEVSAVHADSPYDASMNLETEDCVFVP
jgi:WD40 repeat protein